MRTAKKAHEKNICLNAKENPKLFWAHVRQKLKTKAGVAPLLADKGDINSKNSTIKRKLTYSSNNSPASSHVNPRGTYLQFKKERILSS